MQLRFLQMEMVGFLARFVQLRDSRRWQFSQVSKKALRGCAYCTLRIPHWWHPEKQTAVCMQITNWNSNKQYDLIREYVRQTLGITTRAE